MGTMQLQDFRLYTIGWITALSKELTAAKAMLDENHDQPASFRQTLSDTNNYTWGRVGKHNIVIASLPEGKYGLVSAAVTASFMISSLPHLRFGLMVGIGAGIPRPGKDIRLGDVVVSTPAGEHPGVVQYDLGKLESDGLFKRVGSLAPPPRILLTALTNLKATQPLEGSQMPSILDAMLERYPLLGSQQHGYFHQGPQNDRLFMASSVHVGDNDTIQPPCARNTHFYLHLQLALSWLWSLLLFLCTATWNPARSPPDTSSALPSQTEDAVPPQATTPGTCTRCDPAKEIQRSPRSNNHPIVHYGVIASGNIVVKDGPSRDAILDRLGPECICFEMEAAGLMDNFPCLVIRGICDYANNHKSDQWQNYAAATAAAYAKELLVGYIRAEDVRNADGIEELMGRVAKDTSHIAKTTTMTQEAVQKLRDSDQHQKIMEWLSPPDTSSSYRKALETRQSGTGRWLLDSETYSAWKRASRSSLWLYGIPGCGKTILSSTVIENLSQSETDAKILLYFYFSFADTERQSLNGALRSLIAQLFAKSKQAEAYLVNLFESRYKEDSIKLTTAQLCDTFEQMATKTEEVWIVLDALDECQTREDPNNVTKGLLTWLKNLAGSKTINARVFVTSRPVYDIKSSLDNYVKYETSLQGHLVKGDIRAYVHSVVRQSTSLRRWRGNEMVQREIEDCLVERAQGMFRWVSCQLDILKRCITYPTLKCQLGSLPSTLDETYQLILDKIPSIYEKDSKKLLQFLVFSDRPLLLEEAVDIIAVEPRQPRPRFDPKNRMPIPEEITTYFHSLVVIVKRRTNQYARAKMVKQLQLAHFSVKEYLLSDRLAKKSYSLLFREPSAKAFMAETCLAYLLELETTLSRTGIMRSYPLASYASQYWTIHARQAGNSMDPKLVEEFTESKDAYSLCSRIDQFGINHWDSPIKHPSHQRAAGFTYRLLPKSPTEPPGLLYYMAYNGILSAVCRILEKNPSGVNDTFGRYGTALHAASYQGYIEVVQTLLDKGAKVNVCRGMWGTALQHSVHRSGTDITRLLLEQGADVNADDGYFGTILTRAVAHENRDSAQLLLSHGIDVNARGSKNFANPLEVACKTNSILMINLLLKHGANVNSEAGNFGTPLRIACRRGSEPMVLLLLQHGADVNARGPRGGNPLHAAASRGHVNILKLLLRHGGNIDREFEPGKHPLKAAYDGGHYDAVRIFLEGERPKEILDMLVRCAIVQDIQMLCSIDCDSVFDAGADPNDESDLPDLDNALLKASRQSQESILAMVLERDSKTNPETEDSDYCKALYAAFRPGANEVGCQHALRSETNECKPKTLQAANSV